MCKLVIKNKRYFTILVEILLVLIPIFCNAKTKKLTKVLHPDTIEFQGEKYVVMSVVEPQMTNVSFCYPQLDSMKSAEAQFSGMVNGFIKPDLLRPNYYRPTLKSPEDLSQLPYIIDLFASGKGLPADNYYIYGDFLHKLCTEFIKDDKLFNIGWELMKKNNNRPYSKNEITYPYKRPSVTRRCKREKIGNDIYNIDSLRVRVVAYNDRHALNILEKYYNEKNQSKELAIYYKVMLGYPGNGDLAEKFLYILEPYIPDSPEIINVVRDVMIKAALCDHNARAQELCDSLGFSLCDYRLPRLDE